MPVTLTSSSSTASRLLYRFFPSGLQFPVRRLRVTAKIQFDREMGVLPDSYQEVVEGVELDAYSRLAGRVKITNALYGTIMEASDQLSMISNPEDPITPQVTPVNVNKKKQPRIVAAASAPKKSGAPSDSTTRAAPSPDSDGGRKSALSVEPGSGGGRDEDDGEDDDRKKKHNIRSFTGTAPSVSSSGSSTARSGSEHPHALQAHVNGRQVRYTHRGRVTVVDHDVAFKDSYPTSTSSRVGWYT